MSAFRKAVRDYLHLRRSLGYKLVDAASLLADFVSFLENKAAVHITIPLALEWAQKKSVRPAEWPDA